MLNSVRLPKAPPAPLLSTPYIRLYPALPCAPVPSVQDFFLTVGTPMKVKMCGEEGQSTRFAFVEFATVAECHTAISITGVECCGRTLRIQQSKGAIQAPAAAPPPAPVGRGPEEQERMERTVYVSNLLTAVPEAQVVEFFGLCGRVVNYRFCGEDNQETRCV